MGNKPAIIACGVFREGTGFTRVLDDIFRRLADEFEVHYVGTGYSGAIIDGPYQVYPTDYRVDVFGAWKSAELAVQKSADVVFLCNDLWMMPNYRNALADFQERGGRVVAYCPLDGKIVDDSILESLRYLNQLVLYHESALDQVRQAIEVKRKRDEGGRFPDLTTVPHGVDSNVFYPQRDVGNREEAGEFNIDRREAKAKCFPQLDSPDDAFVVLNANRFHERKRLDLTIEGFGKFAEGQENVWLYLHHAIINQEQVNEIETLARDSNCLDKVILNQWQLDRPCFSNEELNRVYNACDVGVNTSMGEGWGLIGFEHAATGAAQIMPRFSNELLWHDNAIFLESVKHYVPKWSPFEMAEIDSNELAAKLDLLFEQPGLLARESEKSFRHATNEIFNWDAIAKRWSGILKSDVLTNEI